MSKNMQILKLFQWYQPITNDHTRHRDDVINDVVQYDYCGEQGLQISHAYFRFVSAFCFTCKHAETKLKQNNSTETKHCFAFVLFQFCFSFISVITTTLEVCSRRGAIQIHVYLYLYLQTDVRWQQCTELKAYHKNNNSVSGDEPGHALFLWEVRFINTCDRVRLHHCTLGSVLRSWVFLYTPTIHWRLVHYNRLYLPILA